MQRKNKFLAALIILCVIISGSTLYNAFKNAEFTVTFVDVGQGDGAVIHTPGGRIILIDAGPCTDTEMKKSKMLDYLTKHSIKQIDIAIVSHFHDDHYGGFIEIFNQTPPELVLIPNSLSDIENERKELITKSLPKTTHVETMRKGAQVDIGDNAKISALYQWDTPDENEKSLVCLLEYCNNKIMFTGDIGSETEAKMLQELKDIHADVVKVAHHGSKYSSTFEFYSAVMPKYAVIGVGKNIFGHPTPEATQRISEFAEILRTDKIGDITFVLNEKGIDRK